MALAVQTPPRLAGAIGLAALKVEGLTVSAAKAEEMVLPLAVQKEEAMASRRS
jgi:hypothetical protein